MNNSIGNIQLSKSSKKEGRKREIKEETGNGNTFHAYGLEELIVKMTILQKMIHRFKIILKLL